MKKKLRIGKDFGLTWTIKAKNAEANAPYEPSSDSLLLLVTPYNKVQAEGAIFDGNKVRWIFRGKDQKHLGAYGLELVENRGKNGMVTIDTCEAFELVAHTCEETGYDGEDVIFDTLEFITDVELNALRGPQGEQGPVGPAGPSYDDTDVKNKLTKLSEENAQLRERIAEQDILIEDLQNMKIDKENDDYYPNMAVGLADNLAGVDVVDSEINFRRSGGGAISDGVARIESIRGNSVVWNQLFKMNHDISNAGVTCVRQDNNSIVISGTLSSTFFNLDQFNDNELNHKYLFLLIGASNALDGKSFALLNRLASGIISNGFAYIFHTNTDATKMRYIGINYLTIGDTINETLFINQINLTKMFGAGNEPLTIEEFYSRIPQGVDLNAYNEGTIYDMKATGIISKGVNAWDEQWELGNINNGNDIADSNRIRSKNYIRVFPNTAYYVTTFANTQFNLTMYDTNKQYVGVLAKANSFSHTMPSNVHYVRFAIGASSTPVKTYKEGICVNISNADINGKYFPYEEASEDLSIVAKYFPNGMRSAGSAHDEIRYNKLTNKWEMVKRIAEVDLGTQSWIVGSTGVFIVHIQGMAEKLNMTTGLMSKYTLCDTPTGAPIYNNEIDKAYCTNGGATGGAGRLAIRDNAYTDVASFKAAMQGVMFYYELADPIVTEIEEKDFNLDYKVWNCGTEQMVATEPSSALSADITYGFNAVGLLKQIKSALQAAGLM